MRFNVGDFCLFGIHLRMITKVYRHGYEILYVVENQQVNSSKSFVEKHYRKISKEDGENYLLELL